MKSTKKPQYRQVRNALYPAPKVSTPEVSKPKTPYLAKSPATVSPSIELEEVGDFKKGGKVKQVKAPKKATSGTKKK